MRRRQISRCGNRRGVVTLLIMTLIMASVFFWGGSITQVQAKSIRLNYSWITMTKGYSMNLKLSGTKKKAKWKSSNKKIAIVNKKGKVTGKNVGHCTVTVKVGGEKLQCSVTVTKAPEKKEKVSNYKKTVFNVSKLKLNVWDVSYDKLGYPEMAKNKNGTFQLQLLNNKKKIVWSSSDEKIAMISSGLVTAKSKGKCTITAKVGNKKYKCSVTVTDYDDVEVVYNQRNIYIMLGLINKDRVKVKVAPLALKNDITKIADIRAEEASREFSHTRPNGESYKTVYNQVGVKIGSVIGENLAYTMDCAKNRKKLVKTAYKNLYKSKYHKENMLSPKYKYIGIGSYSKIYVNKWKDVCVDTYWAQEFYKK